MDVRANAAMLVAQLSLACSKGGSIGTMSTSIYDTAWVAMVSQPFGGERQWLFPEAFQAVVHAQLPNGAWVESTSEVDGILNTLAALLSLCRHQHQCKQGLNPPDILSRISKAVVWLDQNLQSWDVSKTDQVGFEVIVPAMISALEEYGICLYRPPLLMELNAKKLAKFNPQMLYSNVQSTLLHSLEAFDGKIDFSKLAHHKRHGSMLGSPSSTSAYLMNASEWDDEAEHYLRTVLHHGSGKGCGRLPSAYPSTIFELSWVLSTLLDSGFSPEDLGLEQTAIIADELEGALAAGGGCTGFAPGFVPDADDTAKALLTLALVGRPASPRALIETFGNGTYFKTYTLERNASFSANCNVLKAFLHLANMDDYISHISKTATFLCNLWYHESPKDKWASPLTNLSQQYSMMLLAESFARILDVCGNGKLKGLAEGLLSDQIPCVLIQILRLTLQEQAENGSWGNGSCEVTAYAVLTLSALVSAQATSPLHNTLRSALRTGCSYLTNHADQWKKPHRLWIEKVSYSSPVLSEAYCLAAVSAALYGLKTTEITDEVDCDKQITSMSDFFSRLPIFASCPLWQLKTSLLESNIYRRRLEACRLDIFPRKDMAEDKYLKYIPFTWLGCYRLVATDVPSATLWDMIYVSMLNYQVDEYMEAVVSGICSHSPDLVRSCIRRICGASEGTKDMSAGESYQFTHADSCEKMVGTSHSHGLTTPEESESELSITLSEIEETLSKYVMHFLKHPAVLRTPGAVQHRLRVAIETFLLAHVEQIVDSGQFSKQESNVIFFTQKAYYDWVHTNSAIHTSCPFSFMFYCCLVSESGMELFRSVKSKYLAQAAIGHLATLCRQYNDYGSAIRDSIEGNLNSLNFPEFFEDTGRHQASTREDSEGAFGKQKADLYWLAEYERESLKGALHKLAQEVDEDTMGKVILFVNVTDLYGQIYVAKDIGSRMK